ncbi:MAG: hypothetical protein US98_C0055G0004 [Parcubacteria group bacterium GW2011_GWC1_38_6]|nr:MAG: hypothetical protein US98_C0055G0004 [Parcubacteria group bacterium GW2011_GWC1_38_6]
MEKYIQEVKKYRELLKGNRKSFWAKNQKEFEKNITRIVGESRKPRGWKVYLVVSDFVPHKKILPFDDETWSSTNIVGATKKQGFEIMAFFNRAGSFLSRPALLTLVLHELWHVSQITKSPKKYLKSIVDDKLSMKLEADAEKPIEILPKTIKDEVVLEKILYCYDIGGWLAAKKMADFMYKKREKIYGGGYLQEMDKNCYNAFLTARQKRNINLFIGYLDNDQ